MTTVQTAYARLQLNSLPVAVILISTCVLILTRILSGLQSYAGKLKGPKQVRRPRTVPHWIPWLGHSVSFARDHIDFLEKAR